ncbi:bifunctional diaminohydroxyphosphoribosylaminopyrimidine deaminase/5-amino-6-(5-phosphoribosylamino)uracil reductase RibD [Pseudodesulfovibrio cashew]|uniref:Riboflavin biosynthesis protein RibD n=2 Tax=Pseudodesulfovibrio cashew TaxID=2678688 RepID=A0A6I6JFZ4_9BACT|nr:bifunctional diaminohydroxyphosphoribosylaminopyrimidine deaminase/5-amino-6-(5-phosphoribosylamino)uracil reductase RibD [Pseudodesulfovibrio cashew]
MARAIKLAEQGKGPTAPNPTVGAVLVDTSEGDGTIVAEGYHTRYGALHAERECLADARSKGVDPRGMTMYVTLEPCNHHGKTPPCTEALIEAGVAKVVVGTRDPNPVAAGGVEKLEEHGIKVITGVLEEECRDLIADFLLWQSSHSTFNIIKMAATLDGKIASRYLRPEPVSSPESFARVHELRARVDAVVVGGGTLRADNPSLTCRAPGLDPDFRQPYAVVVTSRLPDNPDAYTLLRDRPEQVILWTTEAAASTTLADELRQRGTSVWPLPGGPRCFNLSVGFERLRYSLGCYTTLIEGGGRFALQCVAHGLADELIHFVCPRILGDNQAPSSYFGRQDVTMEDTMDFRIIKSERTGPDMLLTMRPL